MRTKKQDAASMRNWHIGNLLAFRALAHTLSRERCELVQSIVDDELRSRGAMTYAEQIAKLEGESE